MDIKRQCPKCQYHLTDDWIIKQAASIQGSKKSKKRAKASRVNGTLGGRPRKDEKKNG